MAVGTYALTTVAKVRQYIQETEGDIKDEALAVYCTSTDAYEAFVTVTDTAWKGVIAGGDDASSTTKTFADATDDTVTELVATISAVTGWTARALGTGAEDTGNLIPITETNALGQSNEVTIYTLDNDFIERLIDAVSAQVERYLDRQILTRTYTELYDGTDSNWLHLNQYPITAVLRIANQRQKAVTVQHTGGASATAEVRADGTMVFTDRTSGSTNSNSITLSDHTTFTSLATAIDALSGWSSTIENSLDNDDPTTLITSPGKWAEDTDAYFEVPYEGLYDYELRADDALWRSGGWAGMPNKVWVNYVAGESTTPAGLQMLVTRLVAEAYRQSSRNEQYKKFRLADFSYELGDNPVGQVWSTAVEAELNQWRRIPA